MICDYCDNSSNDMNFCTDCDAMICFDCTIFDQIGDPYCPECFERRGNEPDYDGFFGLG